MEEIKEFKISDFNYNIIDSITSELMDPDIIQMSDNDKEGYLGFLSELRSNINKIIDNAINEIKKREVF